MSQQDRDSGTWHIVRAIQREAGGGVAKAVNVTVFFDAQGKIIGRTDCRVARLMPGEVTQLVSLLFGGD